MEKPTWVFKNISYFNCIKQENGKNIIIFSDFEHNWDLFQFLNNDNEYFFRLNHNYKTKYNFDIIYSTYIQKCKHLDISKITFIIENIEQEIFLGLLPINFNYFLKNNFTSYFENKYNLSLENILITIFPTYLMNEAINIINDSTKILIDNDKLNISIKNILIKRKNININNVNNIVFFGASVTEQQYSYVDYLQKNMTNINIIKKGYSGCHINQAIWLIDDIINLKPDVCFLEWTTSVFKPAINDLEEYLYIIINKLIQNNITPIFLYLYKKDINEYLNIINSYEKIANYFNITSIHQYKIIDELNIDDKLILKDTCHTNFQGSQFYGNILNKIINNYLLNNVEINSNTILEYINYDELYKNSKYNNINVFEIEKLIDISTMDYEIFNNKKYFKIKEKLLIQNLKNPLLIAINILYYKNNGFIHINKNKLQTWDSNCYYKRSGYINLNIQIEDNIQLLISQEQFDTSLCKYETIFPNEKYLWISEIIFI
jgi:hypothetical protein